MEVSEKIILLGDLNEDLLNINYRNLRDILLSNSFQNIISEPTRGRALLDPIMFLMILLLMTRGFYLRLTK